MPEPRDEFYVGYLPLPAGHLRFVRIAVPALLWLMVIAAAVIALLQRSPGDAVWDQGKPIERAGILYEKPYPYIVDGSSAIFLVEQGKRGTQERARGLDGKHVRITGWKLERDGREIMELVPEVSGLVAKDPQPSLGDPSTPSIRTFGPTTLRGEIIDYKCYLGAMKPGDGKSHKSCAILCMTGGIPAMLVTHDSGGPRYTLLSDPSGGLIGQDIIELAGEPVEVAGIMDEIGPVRVLKVQSVSRR